MSGYIMINMQINYKTYPALAGFIKYTIVVASYEHQILSVRQ
jgi:hypothetical protein